MKTNHVKRTFALAASALAISTAVVGCRDYDVMDEEKATLAVVGKQFDEAWIEAFGLPDPNHKWGMDEEIGVIEAFSSAATRAGEIVINRNQWTEFSGTTNTDFPTYNYAPKEQVPVPNYRTSALGHDIQIPGFPHLNGLYYTANGNVSAETKKGSEISSGMIPAGDVTPYEIQYVSNWFRTHQNPVSNVELHLSDFFIQNVSWDNDQVEYKKSGYVEYKTGWTSTGNNGKNIETAAEAIAHKDKDGNAYTTGKTLAEPVSYFLDQLGFQDMEGNWTHVNNFNSGNSNFDPENKDSNPNRMIMYVKSSGTENFRCKPSWCTDTPWDEEWVLVRLTWYETVKDPNSPYPVGTVIPREGYYLGFDFYGTKSEQTINRDGYYSNWIVKITPGFFSPTGNSKRIFCEDLGGSFDWDFNDAVVDVAFEGSNAPYTPIITVQAAGGTMPIYVEKENADYELHRMLGKSKDETELKPINVGSTGGSHTVAIYRGNPVPTTKPGDIHIFVHNTNNNLHYNINGGDEDNNGNASSIDHNGQSTLDESTIPEAPTKIAPSAFSAPTKVKWLNELKKITLAYEDFPNWVKDHTQSTTWYDNVKSGAPLFDASKIQHGTGEYAPPGEGGGGYDKPINWDPLVPDATVATVVAKVNADSYMRLNGYTGTLKPIIEYLDEMGDEQRVTLVAILSSNTLYNQYDKATGALTSKKLQGIVVPADINDTETLYNGNVFNVSSSERFKDATYLPDQTEFGNYAYSIEFSFKKSDIARSSSGYHDYLLFYLKVGDNEVGTGLNGVTVQKWYIHY